MPVAAFVLTKRAATLLYRLLMRSLESQNAQNVQWADQVLTYALGKEATAKIKASIAANTPMRREVLQGHEVNLMPSGGRKRR